MFLFSLPLSLNSAAQWFLNSYNRVVISNTLGTFENGLYAIAIKFGAIINLVVQCFQFSLQEITYEKSVENDERESKYYKLIINEYIKFLFIGLLCITPLIRISYPYLVDEEYYNAINLVPLYLVAMLISAISLYLGSVFGALKNSKNIFVSTMLGSICNVITVHLLIGKFGLQAANISLIVGFLVNVVFRIIVLRRKIKINVNILAILIFIILSAFQILVYIKGSIFVNILTLVIAITIGLISYKEKILLVLNQINFIGGNK